MKMGYGPLLLLGYGPLLLLLQPAASIDSDGNSGDISSMFLPPIEPRVQALLARMTPEAKVSQLFIGRGPKPGTENYPDGFGCTPGMSFIRPKTRGEQQPRTTLAQQLRQNDDLQKWALHNTTYGIPLSFYAETLHTAQNGATIFPAPAGLGCTWNTPLVRQVAETIGYEARLKGIDRAWSPELQVATDPRFGRFDESFAEDPHLVSQLGVAFATGIQGGAVGGADTYGNFSAMLSEAKHFGAYGQSGMDGLHTDIANGTLFNIYLRPWRAFAKKAGGRGVMASHQALNGVPNHANHWLLTSVWRGLFGANHSFIASDQSDVSRLYINSKGNGYGVAADCLSAGALALNAGLDSALGFDCFKNLTTALHQGLIEPSTLDRAAGNVLRAKFAAGLFDGHAYSTPGAASKIRSRAAQQLAYDSAVQSITMVQNTNKTLPLKVGVGGVQSVAVIGPNAGCAGNVTTCDYDGFDPIVAQMGPYVFDDAKNTTSVLQAISKSVGGRGGPLTSISYSQGASWITPNSTLLAEAVVAAKAADVVIVVVGDTDAAYGHGTCAEGVDTDTLDLPGGQLALLDALAATDVPVIAILMNGRPATFGAGPNAKTGPNNALLARLDAVLVAWRPGEAGGAAIWNVLQGKENPSGHLAQNWLRSAGAVRGPSSPWFQPRRSGLPLHYHSESTSPLFSFGFGLSFSEFHFGALQLDETGPFTPGDHLTARVTISSTGPAGQAVVQIYARPDPPTHGVVRFEYTLFCFAKVEVPANSPGVSAAVQCEIGDLDWYDTCAGQYIVPPGSYTLFAAQHSGELPTASAARIEVKAADVSEGS
jgi:beta-glucosidase